MLNCSSEHRLEDRLLKLLESIVRKTPQSLVQLSTVKKLKSLRQRKKVNPTKLIKS
jgi:hypothetical protein